MSLTTRDNKTFSTPAPYLIRETRDGLDLVFDTTPEGDQGCVVSSRMLVQYGFFIRTIEVYPSTHYLSRVKTIGEQPIAALWSMPYTKVRVRREPKPENAEHLEMDQEK